MRSGRARAIAAAGLMSALALGLAPAGAAVAATSQTSVRQESGRAAFHLPYTDPDQAGWLTLCGTNLKPITHGSITTAPFVWRVVSNVRAPKGWWVKGAKAQMFAYQPRPYTPAGAWSGTIMGGPSYYGDRAHPMAQFTPIDSPLTQMTEAFPPIWDHLIELRLYLGAPGTPEDTLGYAAADIQVVGKTWTLVAGGNSSCTAGRVEAEEVAVNMPGASGKPKASQSVAAGSTNGSSPTPSSGGSGGSTGSPGAASGASSASSQSSAGGEAVAGLAVAVVVIAVVVSGGMWWRRRRRATG
jgi:hypothetical protein